MFNVQYSTERVLPWPLLGPDGYYQVVPFRAASGLGLHLVVITTDQWGPSLQALAQEWRFLDEAGFFFTF